MTAPSSSISTLQAGCGHIVLSCYGRKAWFSELSATYPLKLLSPKVTENCVAIAYVLTYGGGLVGGDSINLSVEIGSHAKLLLLSQGSTKVFKTRLQQRMASVQKTQSAQITLQKMDFTIASNAVLFLLPDPVTCFRSASYHQIQTFSMSKDASLIVLDWVTSGRKSLGEDWAFSRYYSVNEIMVEGKRIGKDVMLLEDGGSGPNSVLCRTLADKLSPYSCYATLILRGRMVEGIIARLTALYENISIMQRRTLEDLLWSLSPISADKEDGIMIRVAGKETEIVKRWLKNALLPMEQIVGIDVYRRAFV
ncbi:hypothetical protein GYMLUDRAFT_66076 [Collybiopsis luxurians FD-317 M1]|nr:hypothetical protein GYMLUDRAFT_66076 [Collybiopsis luxurians FD-317 M1]